MGIPCSQATAYAHTQTRKHPVRSPGQATEGGVLLRKSTVRMQKVYLAARARRHQREPAQDADAPGSLEHVILHLVGKMGVKCGRNAGKLRG